MLSPQNHQFLFPKREVFHLNQTHLHDFGVSKCCCLVVATQTFGIFTPENWGRFLPILRVAYVSDGLVQPPSRLVFVGWDRPTTLPNVRCGMSEARTRSVLCGAIITKAKLLRFGKFFCFFGLPSRSLTWPLKISHPNRNVIFQPPFFRFHVNLPGCTLCSADGQLLVWGPVVWDWNWIPLSNNPFQKGILGIQTTGPQTNN